LRHACDQEAEVTFTAFLIGLILGVFITVLAFVIVDGRDERNYERD
jgi:heme/copper-type cytochrome/quinol oxidase subunit 4